LHTKAYVLCRNQNSFGSAVHEMIKGHLVELVGQDPRVNQTLIMKRQRKCPLWTVTTNIVHWKSPAGKYTKDWTTHVKWGIPPSQKFI